MRLKRLSLHGYKTFATKTEFEFGHGITAIVGPNGCGKSNIADAIRWVLGEQSYSTLRGRRTTDMIFAGSRSRSRAGMAQAVLTLDNQEGWLALDYAEIEIGRRAYRSGENEYVLNQQKVRLRDVNELLANSGLGARTYTIIGQGLVDQALSLRADERRGLFEEAAGISHYKLRRAETIRHLDETKHNLERIYDIIAEIEPRLRSLKTQANRAKNYEHVAADLHHHLRIWFGFHWEKARIELRASREESHIAQQKWDAGRKGQLSIQQDIDTSRREINRLVRVIQDREDDRESLRTDLETANRQAAIMAERLDFIKKRLIEIEEDVPRLEKQRTKAQAELENAILEFESARKHLEKEKNVLLRFEQRVQAEESAIEKWELTLSDLDLKRTNTQAQMNQASGSLEQLRERLEARQLEVQDSLFIEQFNKEVEDRKQAFASVQSSIEVDTSRQHEFEQSLTAVSNKLRGIEDRQAENDKIVKRLALERAGLESQRKTLESIDSPFHADLSKYTSLFGSLAELMTIQPKYENAVRSALAERFNTLVLKGDQDLWNLADTAPSGSFIANLQLISPNPKLDAPKSPHAIGWASEFVNVDESLTNLVDHLLGRFLIVSAKPAEALVLAGKLAPGSALVTMDGLIIFASGLIKTPARLDKEILERRRDLEKVIADIDENEGQRLQFEQDSLDLERECVETQASLDGIVVEIQELRDRLADSKRIAYESRIALESAESKLRSTTHLQDTLAKEIGSLKQRIFETEQLIDGYLTTTEKFESSIDLASLELKELPAAEIADERRHLEQSVEAGKTIVAGRQAVVDSRRATLVQIDEQLERIDERIVELRSSDVDIQLAERIGLVDRLQAEMDSLKTGLAPVQSSLRENQDSLSVLEKRLSDHLIQNQAAENGYLQARLALNQAENRIEGLRERISTDLGLVDLPFNDDEIAQSPLPMTDVVDRLPIVEELPEDIERTIQRLRGQLHRMGGINPDAPVEYDETKQRHEFLQKQVVDLNATIAQLEKVIVELDDLTSKAFVETVRRVDENFGQVFRRLFGGGTGRLVLTDPDQLTTTGVDIVARLPNRQEQALGLLSGGERSLTATALIFSLLMVSPTPFCVLDEVDAMLDEANVNRFREMLQELSQDTQFIIITHNRGTVQVAESVYGVSMGADSASQVISIKPEEYVGFSTLG